MKKCKHCNHDIRKIRGIWKHRMEHPKYSGIGGSGGVTFNQMCCSNKNTFKIEICRCKIPEPKIIT